MRSMLNVIEKKYSNVKKIIINIFNKRSSRQLFFLTLLTCFLIAGTFAWFYSEFVSTGTDIRIGKIEHEVVQYDTDGVEIPNDDQTVIFENSMQAGYYNSRYFSVKNTGNLDMQYNVTFDLDATIADAGILYYRLYDITDEVLATSKGSFSTKLEAYVDGNRLTTNPENDVQNPISNMSTLGSNVLNDRIIINDEDNLTSNPKYYRIDYGMYQVANTSKYSDTLVAVHTNVYSTQLAADLTGSDTGQTWIIENETQLRNAMIYAINGDTILLNGDVQVEGSLAFDKLVSINLNGHKLSVTGDLSWDVVYDGKLLIDATNRGVLEVGNDLYINTPKSQIEFSGSNGSYDVYVGGVFTVNGIQDGEKDGVLIDECRIVKNVSSMVPADVEIMSNTRFTVGANVQIGYIHAVEDSTNVEIINNGTITQIDLSDMTLLDTFSKYQIYVYNLNVIYGVVGSSSIILPPEAVPYTGVNNGNTLIIQGLLASDVSIEGSTHFNHNDIQYSDAIASVVPIDDEENAYYVYIRESTDVLEDLLVQYFVNEGMSTPYTNIAQIEKLVVYTVNAQYVEDEDFTFLRDNLKLPNLKYLGLGNARVYNNSTSTENIIKPYALANKASLKTLILPNTVTSIGEYAFSGIELGYLPASQSDQFNFITIPASVTSIGAHAFENSRYVKFESVTPPTIGASAFNMTSNGAKIFVPESSLALYMNTTNLNEAYIHQSAYLSDNRNYFIYDTTGVGISLYIGTATIGSNLTVPATITTNRTSYPVTAVGANAYRDVNLTNSVSLILPNTVTEIGYGAFKELNITSANLGNVVDVGSYAFYKNKFTTIKASRINNIGDYAFYNITTINSATFASLKSIGQYALAEAPNLHEVDLGQVMNIGNYALYHTPGVLRVYFSNITTEPFNNTYTVDMNIGTESIFSEWGYYSDGRLRVYVPDGKDGYNNEYIDLYKKLDIFKDNTQYIYPQGVITGDFEYLNYDIGEFNYRVVTINGVEGAELVDYHGTNLSTGFDIPTNVQLNGDAYDVISIGEGAFRNVTTTANAVISITGTNLLKIADYGFYNAGITSITADEVTYIGDYAFGNTSLTSGSFEALQYLGEYALYNMESLNSLNLGRVSTIRNNAVSNTPNLTQVFILNPNVASMTIVGTPFNNIGANAQQWLRIYVPETALNDYKTLLPSYANYIYENGDVMYGTSTHGTINYDIGQYMLKYVTLNDNNGVAKQGVKIIDYHGDYIDSDFSFPNTFTIDGTAYEVISIGQRAFKYATTTDNSTFDIRSSSLIEIGDYAFSDSNIINTIVANGVTTIGAHAFDNSTLTSGTFEKLNTLSSFAFSNSEYLYHLNLGKVKIMPAYSIYNLPKLSQIFFDVASGQITFSSLALWNIGSSTNDRMRIYVPATNAGNGLTYVDVYKAALCDSNNDYDYSSYFYARGVIMGNYTQPNIPFNIGEYTIVNKTVNNYEGNAVDGYEFVEYHGANLTSNYYFPEKIDIDNDLSVQFDFVNTSNSKMTYTVTITNNSDSNVTDYRLVLGTMSGYEFDSSSVNSTIDGDNVILSGTTTSNSRINANSSITLTVTYKTSDASFVPKLRRIYDYNNDTGVEIISVGNNAYRHISMDTGTKFNVRSDSLLNIGSYAFYQMGINSIIAPNVSTIGSYAFADSSLTEGRFTHLKTIYTNAFSRIPTLYMLDLGQVSTMEENSLYMLPKLSQVFFDGQNSVSFNPNAITSVGTATGTTSPYYRVRFYVTDDTNGQNIEYVEMYKALFPTYADYFYPEGTIIGNYTQPNIPYDIGEHSVRLVTIDNASGQPVTGYEIDEYHGEDMSSSYNIPDRVVISDKQLNVSISDGFDVGGGATGYTLTITNNNDTVAEDWAMDLSQDSTHKVNYVQYGQYLDHNTYASISNITDLPIAAGGSVSIQIWYNSTDTAFLPYASNVREPQVNETAHDVISIGNYAYKHTKKLYSTSQIELYNESLLNIGDYAFNGLGIFTKAYLNNVVTIGDYAFYSNDITELKVDNVNSIGNYAFAENQNLMYAYLGKVQKVGNYAFNEDYSIEQIFFTSTKVSSGGNASISVSPTAFTNAATTIGTRLRVYVPDGNSTASLTYAQAYKNVLDDIITSGTTNLGKFVYPTGVIIGSYTSAGLSYDIGEYSVREVTRKNLSNGSVTGLEVVEYHGATIDNDTNLFTIPNQLVNTGYNSANLISIGPNSFTQADINSWDLLLGPNIIYIGDYAFYEKNVTTLNASDINTVGQYAFYNCDQLSSITFSGLVNVGEYAFAECNNLTDLYLGSNGVRYGDYAFYYPYNEGDATREFIILAETPPTASAHTFPGYRSDTVELRTSFFGYTTYTYYEYNVHIQVPTANERTYESTSPYSIYASAKATSNWTGESYGSGDRIDGVSVAYGYSYSIITTNTVRLTSYRGYSSSVTIPSTSRIGNKTYTITEIGAYAFDNANYTDEIIIPSTVTYIEPGFLKNNTSIETIGVNSANTHFSSVNGILYSKDGTVLIRFPNGKATSIAATNGTTYASFTINNTTTMISAYAFANAQSLGSITIPANVTTISSLAFKDCIHLSTYRFLGTTPPKLTGFDAFPIISGLAIKVPNNTVVNTFKGTIYYNQYSNYISRN